MEIKVITSNKNKYIEIEEIFKRYNIKSRWIKLKIDEIQSESLHEIVVYKSMQTISMIRPPFVIEDSALFIHALNGFPGPYSSYIYRKIGNIGIIKLMDNINDRRAEFISVISLCIEGNIIKLFTGKVEGMISLEERGKYGFGFDPIFIPKGKNKTLAEMSIYEKNLISHRGKGFKRVAEYIKGENYG